MDVLIKKVTTPFGITFHAKNISESSTPVQDVKLAKSNKASDKKRMLFNLLATSGIRGSTVYSVHKETISVLGSLFHAQTDLDLSKMSTLMKAISISEEINLKLVHTTIGIRDLSTFGSPTIYAQHLAKRTGELLHDLWCGSCYLYPCLIMFTFFPQSVAAMPIIRWGIS